MKHLVITLLFLIHFSSFSQSVNDYKYVIIPEKYDFLKNIDQYQLNSLTQFLFNKYGFDSYRERDQKPLEYRNDSCNILYADVEGDSSLIVTRLTVILKDCNGKVIFTSKQGKSKDKDFKIAYHTALRKAFISIEGLKYSYNGKTHNDTTPEVVETPTDVVSEMKIKEAKEVKGELEEVGVIENVISNFSGTYTSSDGIYKLIISEENLIIYEGTEKIGKVITNDTKTYEVFTTQFNGKGRFKNNSFIVDRVVKGVGLVQMIFSKN